MNKKYLLAITLLFGILFASRAQDVQLSKLRWSVNGLTDLKSNSESSYSCTFETDGSNAIIWRQKEDISTLKVLNMNGAWSDVKLNGGVVYNILIDGLSGTLTFKRTSYEFYTVLDLSNGIKHRYTLSRVELNN